jgi:hypothetical protein
MTAATQAILITPDQTLTAPGVGRHPLLGDPLPLRLRLVYPHPRTPSSLPTDLIPALTQALATP